MLQKKHAKSDYVFHQADGLQWKSILESFRSLLKRCEFKRSGVHILRHTFGAHLAQKGVDTHVDLQQRRSLESAVARASRTRG
jgi:site-specific recombinase XerD